MSYYVYVHVFPNGKHYVGITSQLPTYRWRKDGNGYKNQTLVYRAIQKYGWNNIEHCILEYDLTEKEACDREIHYISLWKSDNPEFGYNIEPGGSRDLKTMSDETKLKISESLKGRAFTEEHRAKIGQANLGRQISEETRQKISDNHADVSGQKNPRAVVPLYCPELDETFWGAKEAADKYGFNRNHITSCANGKLKHTGKHPVTGVPLSWIKVESKNY